MKILIFTTHISIDNDSRFSHNKTGFGYMVYDIAKSIGQVENVDLFCANIMTPDVYRDNIHILKWNWSLFLRFFSFSNAYKAISFLRHYRVSLFTLIRVFYAFLLTGYVRHLIKKYDVVQIHGCSFYTQAIMDVCKSEGVPFLITLHGLNSFDESIEIEKSMGRFEKDFLSSAYRNHTNISFISSGDIKKVCSYLKLNETPSFFTLISNGCDVVKRKAYIDVRDKLGIAKGSFIFLFVGNITKNKNQIEVAKAYTLLPSTIQQNTTILFCGNICDDGKLIEFINDNNLGDNLFICGFVPKEEICNYYSSSNATILTSYSEGFGLSIIEGFVYGKPNLTYEDLSAVPDIFNPSVMMAIERKDEVYLAGAMQKMMTRNWDANQIEEYSSCFSLEMMAERYVILLRQITGINGVH